MTRASRTASDEARGARELLLDVELRRGRLRSSLRESLRDAIQTGRLPAASRLPSSRRLAEDLGVSRGVVTDAYDQLASEGYLEVRPRSAPVVSAVVGIAPPTPEPDPEAWRHDFVATTPDVGLFPRRAWLRAMERALRATPDVALDYGDHRGRIELREALSGYLARVRGVRADPGRIVVTQGFTQALDLVGRALARRGRDPVRIAVETPSLPDAWATIRESGATVIGCPVDADGLVVEALGALRADAVVVTPAHQFPTGAVMAPHRRLALVTWAATTGGLVIEDDYDAEFRYDRLPVGAIQGLAPDRVVHIGTASKTLAPGLRLGWLTLPPALVDEVRERKKLADSGSPAIDQLAFAELLLSGDYERHVARARADYRRRRDRLVDALHDRLPDHPVKGAAAGMHVLLDLGERADDVELAKAAAGRGIGVRPLSPLHLEPAPSRGLLLGYGRLPENRIEPAVTALAEVLSQV
jgi:GntR family transcriptional regulator/MocR family aminotransferase